MNGKTARKHSTPAANHWLDQPAASFGWTVEAAAGQPLRSAEEAQNDFEGLTATLPGKS